MAEDNFKVNPSVFLGLDYSEFQNDVYALALSKPSDYFAMRKRCLQAVKQDAIKNLYETFYTLLSDGVVGGNSLFKDVDGAAIQPKYPTQKISEFALSAAKTLDAICQQAIDILLPLDYKTLASDRMRKIGEAGIH
jgi:hypothetical protein